MWKKVPNYNYARYGISNKKHKNLQSKVLEPRLAKTD